MGDLDRPQASLSKAAVQVRELEKNFVPRLASMPSSTLALHRPLFISMELGQMLDADVQARNAPRRLGVPRLASMPNILSNVGPRRLGALRACTSASSI
jgi:hypothetical protein